ncbi:hypothetical protein AQJ67_18565 [Streptomyces caeruleatus]|uniref:Uncharacterized protein n=1 Tax=Streptomyces caeruleatus TaxID=661399 RepID=A0A101U2P5_9ACTN|nr:hypothetical protein AQJ67_18565 [Streptomyces caeruleatus]
MGLRDRHLKLLAHGAERLDELTGGHGGAAAPPSPPALGRVRRRHPRLQVELISATRQLTLRPSGFDLALAVGVPSSSRQPIPDAPKGFLAPMRVIS